MNNIMLDFETWGTEPGSALRSIGATEFDPYDNGHGRKFYANISDASCLDAGLVKTESTVKWWAHPSRREANAMLMTDQRPLAEVADAFHQFWRDCRSVFVWGQGASFDPVLWECAMRAIKRTAPWKFWDIRCTRTAYDMGQFNPRTVKFTGTPHHALHDSQHQVVCVQRAYANVHGKKKES
jgi:hypothetical protein